MNNITPLIYRNITLLPKDERGWNGNSNVFPTLIEEIKPEIIIEVGSWKGQSAINMGKAVKKLGLNTTIYCVDTWLGATEFWTTAADSKERDLKLLHGYPQIYYQFLSNVVHNNLEDVILPFPNTSETGFRYFQYKEITSSLIYIDASHEEDDVYKDLTNYIKLLNPGGIIFGDDFTAWPGVRKAVARFTNENNLSYEVLERNFWVIRK
jgi:hypothetical protein